ncbi:MAG: ATP-binding protein [Chloroflexota bacterium]
MKGLPGRGLTVQLAIFVVLPLTILLIAIPLGSLTLHGRAMRVLVGERDQRAARAAAAAITEQLNHRAAAIQGLALSAAATPDPASLLASYVFLQPDFEGGLALFTAGGALLAATSPAASWQSRPVAELLAQTSRQGEAQFSAAFADSSGGAMMTLVAAAADGPTAVGVFAPATLARRTLGDDFSASGQPFVLMVDGEGRLLYQDGTTPSESGLTEHPGVAEALRGRSGTTYLAVQGDEHVVAFSPVEPVGWALVFEEPWRAVDNPLLRRTQAAPLILIPVLLFALLALGFGLRQIVQPLRVLEQQANELAWGRFEAIERPVGGIAEIRHLQAELIGMARKVQSAQRNLRSYLGAITVGQEDERQRLARELHDGPVQALVALDQQAQLAQLTVKDISPAAAERLAAIRSTTAALMDELRRVIRALRPIYLEDLGLLPAIEVLVRDLGATPGTQVTFATSGRPRRLPTGQEIAVYRIVQEALNNAARYATAQTIHVTAAFEPAELAVRVQDDGRGFTAPERVSDLVASGHYGLMGMQERAELIGARLTIQSSPGAGTTIELRLPLGSEG